MSPRLAVLGAVLLAMPVGGPSDESTTREASGAPARWGTLDLREPLGAGAFGTVYRAWDPKLQKEVALKVLRPVPGRDDGALLDEARRLARIRHPHVVTVYGADVDAGSVGFWMELVRGVTLEQLRTHGPMSAYEAAGLGSAMAQALAAVHSTQLVHGDLKARNIMREEGGRYVLTDFGASRGLETVSADASAAVVGTPLYMAPEVLRGAMPSAASDVYSLGVLLFHAVTREYPVAGATMADVRDAHARGARRRLRDVRPDLPAAFVKVVERALSPDPGDRFATAGAMEDALATILVSDAETRRRRRNAALGVGAMAVAVTFAGWTWSRGRPPGAVDLGSIRTVAVLPFDISGSLEQETFGRGFTEMLTHRLCEVASLRVVSQTSARRVHGLSLGIKQIGETLGADAVIEGSVRTSAGRVRVSARLVLAATDTVIWQRTFEDDVRDVLQLQSDLALALGRQLGRALSASETQRLRSPEAASPEAQDAFLRGWASLELQTADGAREAVRQFERAVTLDPAYARAFAMLSHAYWYLGVGASAMPRAESEARARAAAQRAQQLDPDLPRAHAALAQVHFYYDWNWTAARQAFEAAVRLDPSDADAHQQFGWFLASQGLFEEALIQTRLARELDPLSPSRRSPVAAVLYYAGRHDEAIAELDQALAVLSDYRTAHFGKARAYAALGRTADALRELEASARSESVLFQVELARVHAQAGDEARARTILAELERRRASAPDSVPPDALAILNAALGRIDRALDLVEEAHRRRDPTLVWLKVDPRYNLLRTQPRFAAVLSVMGLGS